MNEWNKAFPKPDRSNHTPQQNARRTILPEIDTGRRETVMNDGRPVVIEYWEDVDFGLRCRTAFYSTLGTDDWSEDDHYAYLEDNGLLEGKTYPYRGVGLGSLVDASGNEIWSATVAMHKRDDE